MCLPALWSRWHTSSKRRQAAREEQSDSSRKTNCGCRREQHLGVNQRERDASNAHSQLAKPDARQFEAPPAAMNGSQNNTSFKTCRDHLLLEATSSIITVFSLSHGAVLHQNYRSQAYYGELAGASVCATEAAGASGTDGLEAGYVSSTPVRELFVYEPEKFHRMMQDLSHGRMWKGVLRVPSSLARVALEATPLTMPRLAINMEVDAAPGAAAAPPTLAVTTGAGAAAAAAATDHRGHSLQRQQQNRYHHDHHHKQELQPPSPSLQLQLQQQQQCPQYEQHWSQYPHLSFPGSHRDPSRYLGISTPLETLGEAEEEQLQPGFRGSQVSKDSRRHPKATEGTSAASAEPGSCVEAAAIRPVRRLAQPPGPCGALRARSGVHSALFPMGTPLAAGAASASVLETAVGSGASHMTASIGPEDIPTFCGTRSTSETYSELPLRSVRVSVDRQQPPRLSGAVSFGTGNESARPSSLAFLDATGTLNSNTLEGMLSGSGALATSTLSVALSQNPALARSLTMQRLPLRNTPPRPPSTSRHSVSYDERGVTAGVVGSAEFAPPGQRQRLSQPLSFASQKLMYGSSAMTAPADGVGPLTAPLPQLLPPVTALGSHPHFQCPFHCSYRSDLLAEQSPPPASVTSPTSPSACAGQAAPATNTGAEHVYGPSLVLFARPSVSARLPTVPTSSQLPNEASGASGGGAPGSPSALASQPYRRSRLWSVASPVTNDGVASAVTSTDGTDGGRTAPYSISPEHADIPGSATMHVAGGLQCLGTSVLRPSQLSGASDCGSALLTSGGQPRRSTSTNLLLLARESMMPPDAVAAAWGVSERPRSVADAGPSSSSSTAVPPTPAQVATPFARWCSRLPAQSTSCSTNEAEPAPAALSAPGPGPTVTRATGVAPLHHGGVSTDSGFPPRPSRPISGLNPRNLASPEPRAMEGVGLPACPGSSDTPVIMPPVDFRADTTIGAVPATPQALSGAASVEALSEAAALAAGRLPMLLLEASMAGIWCNRQSQSVSTGIAPAAVACELRSNDAETSGGDGGGRAGDSSSIGPVFTSRQRSLPCPSSLGSPLGYCVPARYDTPVKAGRSASSTGADICTAGAAAASAEYDECDVYATFRQSALASPSHRRDEPVRGLTSSSEGNGRDRDSPKTDELQAVLLTAAEMGPAPTSPPPAPAPAPTCLTLSTPPAPALAPAGMTTLGGGAFKGGEEDRVEVVQLDPSKQAQPLGTQQHPHRNSQETVAQQTAAHIHATQRKPSPCLSTLPQQQQLLLQQQQQQQRLLQQLPSLQRACDASGHAGPPFVPQFGPPPRTPSRKIPASSDALGQSARYLMEPLQSRASSAGPSGGVPQEASGRRTPAPSALHGLVPDPEAPCCWHRVVATRATDPVTGQDVVLLTQDDVSAKVLVERQLGLMLETEHRLLEQIYPLHILRHLADELVTQQQRVEREEQIPLAREARRPAVLTTAAAPLAAAPAPANGGEKTAAASLLMWDCRKGAPAIGDSDVGSRGGSGINQARNDVSRDLSRRASIGSILARPPFLEGHSSLATMHPQASPRCARWCSRGW